MADFPKELQLRGVSKPTLRRLPTYLNYLKTQEAEGRINISATVVAAALGLNEVQVRKDLSLASRGGGRPKTGYSVSSLIEDIETFLGYRNTKEAILVGVGRLGSALLSYSGIQECGVRLAAAFDNDPEKIGRTFGGVTVHDIAKLPEVCQENNIHIAILTTPPELTQSVCPILLKAGILAIWNFSPVHLKVPKDIIVHNEDLAVSLTVLAHDLEKALRNRREEEDPSC